MNKHDTLLIISSSAEIRARLRDVMERGYNILETVNPEQAMFLMAQNTSCIAALLIDIVRLEPADKVLLQEKKCRELFGAVPVIVFDQNDDAEELNRAFSLGAADVIPLDYEPYAMLRRIENIVNLHLHQKHLESMVEEQALALQHTNDSMVDVLSSIIEYRSIESGQHILRIRHFTKILLEEVVRSCPEYKLTERIIAIISSAAALHDIGKIAIPDAILMKAEPLTAEERKIMQTHALTGCHILNAMIHVADSEYLRYAHNICHYHHERWDGTGYPEGLAGDQIPLCAQVVGLADVYDALTSKRVYKDAYSCAQTVNMILKGECGAFSPKLLECFKHVVDRFEELAKDYADGKQPKAEILDTTLPQPDDKEYQDSIDFLQEKYYTLVHQINGLFMELDIDQGLFHIVYNPYPELARFDDVRTLAQLEQALLDRIVHPSDRNRMYTMIRRDLKNFLREGLRRQVWKFNFRTSDSGKGTVYELTVMRINPSDHGRRRIVVLVKEKASKAAQTRGFHRAAPENTICCKNDRKLSLIYSDSAQTTVAGYTVSEIAECFNGQLMELIHPDDRENVRLEITEQLRNHTQCVLKTRMVHKDGSIPWMLVQCTLQIDEDQCECLHLVTTDISKLGEATENLQKKLDWYEIVLAQTENVLFEWEVISDRVEFSDTWEKIFGFKPIDHGLRAHLESGAFFHPDDLPLVTGGLEQLEQGSNYEKIEVRIATGKGRYLWCRIRATAIRDASEALKKISGVIINIDAEKQVEQALQERAERDSLTKLLNKEAGRRQAEAVFVQNPDGVDCALLIIDLDNFKQVNDQYGHLFGDAVLTRAAKEINKLFRNHDIVARIGGDEFMVLMRGVSNRKLVEDRCCRLLEAFRNIFGGEHNKLPMSCSVGIALSPEHGKTYFDLFNMADQALYQAKGKGKNNFAFYNPEEEYFYSKKKVTAINQRIDSDEEPGLAEDNLVRFAFQRLYASSNVEKSVNDILELVGKKMNVSRVYVFENSDDNRYCSNTFEWCNVGITPEIDNLQNISYEEDIPDYMDNFDEKGIFYCPDINYLPPSTYEIVAPQGIKSMLHCAFRDEGVFRGYIGFDECVEYRYWTKDQIQTLTYFSEMLSLFLMKYRKQEKTRAYANQLQSILDNQKAWIYIVDPDTCRIKYLNAKTRSLAVDAQVGMCCYQAIKGQEKRCKDCPAQNIKERKNSSAVLRNERFDLKVLAEATLIQWEGEESCLLTCRELEDMP